MAIAQTLLQNPGLNIGQSTQEAARTALRLFRETHGTLRSGAKGYGLVAREIDPEELRRNRYSLTAQGYAFAHKLVMELQA